MRVFIDETSGELKDVKATVEGVKSTMSAELESVKASIGLELESVKTTLSSEIAGLTAAVDRVLQPDSTAGTGDPVDPDGSAAGQTWHCNAQHHRGSTGAGRPSTPVGGNYSGRQKNSSNVGNHSNSNRCDYYSYRSRVELPQFDGAHPKLWQRRCEEYFKRWATPAHLWILEASSLFSGAATMWLEAYLQQSLKPTWSEFVEAVMLRFCRNEHQILVRRWFHISQETAGEDYVKRFCEFVDQISAYESKPNPVHYVTRFLDGLRPAVRVRVRVAIQQPRDLDIAYSLALLYEELGDGLTPINSHYASPLPPRRAHHQLQPSPPPPPAKWISKTVEEKRVEQQKHTPQDKWTNIKAYRCSKNLCFTCGENIAGTINVKPQSSFMWYRK